MAFFITLTNTFHYFRSSILAILLESQLTKSFVDPLLKASGLYFMRYNYLLLILVTALQAHPEKTTFNLNG